MGRGTLGTWSEEVTLRRAALASLLLMGPGWVAYGGAFVLAGASPRDAGVLAADLAGAEPLYVALVCAAWVWGTALAMAALLAGICLGGRIVLHGALDLVGLDGTRAGLPSGWAVRSFVLGAAVMVWLAVTNAASAGPPPQHEALRFFALSLAVGAAAAAAHLVSPGEIFGRLRRDQRRGTAGAWHGVLGLPLAVLVGGSVAALTLIAAADLAASL